ncbi:uncharacterized protein LOC110681857 isoform X2 [Chenopodium quinoa]|uniref:uncharacterized protein LOC110681857 isoform X2 n=1 Tax=Chenopodium quinoa TaxID=63459 RepID=UPI000B78C3DD|nr:uncharacterized protein LOC110681857 isoform X2 [Chenopodium quinoa]XP_021713693.1 uncharacterized protein LOC110681857 isoform X2 [Chenopodium quinoa]
MKSRYIMLSLLISGPKQPGNDIDVYLAPLIEDLKLLWNEGVQMFDAYSKTNFTLRAMIFCTINDFPAYGNLSGYTVKGRTPCPICEDDPFANIQEPVPCRLSLLKNDSEKVIVAEGTYHPELILDHHSNLIPDHVRVSVDDFFDEFKEFSVPVPSSVIKKLKHAHSTFTQWPKDLVSLMHDKEFISNKNNGNNKAAKENMQDKLKVVESGRETKESNTNPKKVFLMDYALENLSQKCGSLNSLLSSLPEGETIKVKADAWTFSYEDNKDIIIKREDVNQLLTGAWLNISVLQVFMMALSDLLDTEEVASIGFMCPEMISETYLHSDADRILLYMTHVMEKQKSKQFILCPYHEKNHWVLLVLCMAKREVIIFDSLRQKRNLAIKFAMTNAFRSFKALSGKSRGSKLTWHLGQCPQQLGGRECGYYVMRYMYEILNITIAVKILFRIFQELHLTPRRR